MVARLGGNHPRSGGLRGPLRGGAEVLATGASGSLRVVGRVSLSPRHSIYMVRAGERVWLIGTGSQGAPTLLGELTAEAATPRAATGLDVRLGEEE